MWNDAHVAELRSTSIRYTRGLRLATLQAYGGPAPRCACCGESYLEFLCIDQIGGDDTAQRAQLRAARSGSSTKLYRWLRDNQFPPGFRVLCHNCTMAIGFYGHCPHERERQT
jgi:uncharacterized protein (DUF2336 family)